MYIQRVYGIYGLYAFLFSASFFHKLFWILSAFLVSPSVRADEPAVDSSDKTKQAVEEAGSLDKLTPDAVEAIQALREQLPPDSEAIAMLESILSGRRLGAEDGWFPMAKSQTRFDWDYVAKAYDKNKDQTIDQSEYRGGEKDFGRLDRKQDGKISEADFDWSQHSLTRTPGFMLFFMADRDTNGKVTKDEFEALFDSFSDGGDFIAIDDLRDRLNPPPPSSAGDAPDKPSRSTLVMGLKRQEVGSLQPGPQLNETAPDFTLKTLQGESVTLSEQIGEKPVVLIFGNFTCGPFRSQAGNLEKFYARYRDRANIYLIYVREAHPTDGWWMLSNQKAGVSIHQPTNDAERLKAATSCRNLLDLKLPFLVDQVDDQVGSVYSGMPNRLYLIDREGKVAFKSGRGPFGFHPRQLEQALLLLLSEDQRAD
jgi:hypothetical protein